MLKRYGLNYKLTTTVLEAAVDELRPILLPPTSSAKRALTIGISDLLKPHILKMAGRTSWRKATSFDGGPPGRQNTTFEPKSAKATAFPGPIFTLW